MKTAIMFAGIVISRAIDAQAINNFFDESPLGAMLFSLLLVMFIIDDVVEIINRNMSEFDQG